MLKRGMRMEERLMTKPEVVELVTMIHRRKRNTRDFKGECELYSWEPRDAKILLENIPKKYQERYNQIIDEYKQKLEALANEVIEKEFFTCEVIEQ